MKAAGETASNPFVESFTYPGNIKRLFVALFGIAAGLTVIWYTAMFSTLSFLKGPMRVDDTTAELIIGGAAVGGVFFYLIAGHVFAIPILAPGSRSRVVDRLVRIATRMHSHDYTIVDLT